MRSFFTVLLGIATIIVLIIGNMYWNDRTKASSQEDTAPLIKKIATKDAGKKEEVNLPESDFLAYTANWPEQAVETFKQARKEKKPFHILFLGSSAIGTESEGAYPLVKQKLVDTFGKKVVKVELQTFNNTSTKFIEEGHLEKLGTEPDMVIFEPFILKNNGLVLVEDTLADVSKIMDTIQSANPDATIILQPSYPLYNAKIYPQQVASLKTFAEVQQITYLDHWSAWPDPNTEAIKEYLTPNAGGPSEKGYQVWSDYLLDYLISK